VPRVAGRYQRSLSSQCLLHDPSSANFRTTNPHQFQRDFSVTLPRRSFSGMRSNGEPESTRPNRLLCFTADVFADWLFLYSLGPRCGDDASSPLARQLDIEGKMKI
jgi:hypothetical protein